MSTDRRHHMSRRLLAISREPLGRWDAPSCTAWSSSKAGSMAHLAVLDSRARIVIAPEYWQLRSRRQHVTVSISQGSQPRQPVCSVTGRAKQAAHTAQRPLNQGRLPHLHGLYKFGSFLPDCCALLSEPAHEFHTARLLLRAELQGVLHAPPQSQ